MHSIDHVLKVPSPFNPKRKLSDAVDTGIDGIRRSLGSKSSRFTGCIKSEESRKAVLRGALALYGADQKASALELCALLKSEEIFETTLEEIINDHFDISGWICEE
ncbi:MAG: hypothetical protein C5B53_02125 [Candidatus Melainabacteria bacterium]|nr:MAG: hypothetical protein C5B53_02125 [Candidatus Melainabacteria bacterium]